MRPTGCAPSALPDLAEGAAHDVAVVFTSREARAFSTASWAPPSMSAGAVATKFNVTIVFPTAALTSVISRPFKGPPRAVIRVAIGVSPYAGGLTVFTVTVDAPPPGTVRMTWAQEAIAARYSANEAAAVAALAKPSIYSRMNGPLCPPENAISSWAVEPGAAFRFDLATNAAHFGSFEEACGLSPLAVAGSMANPAGMSVSSMSALLRSSALRGWSVDAGVVVVVLLGGGLLDVDVEVDAALAGAVVELEALPSVAGAAEQAVSVPATASAASAASAEGGRQLRLTRRTIRPGEPP